MTSPNLSEREQTILDLLSEDSSATVTDISGRLEVSPVTVRSDLAGLAEKGLIVRTHGGAFPAFHPSIAIRQRDNVKAKARIAKAAASLVRDGDTIMIEAGTTTALIAKYLLGKRDVHVVTNSTLIIPHARFNPGVHLTVVGGEFRPATESMVGPVALRDLEQFHVRLAFIGTDGFSTESGLTTHLVEGAEIVRKMAAQAETTVLVADSTKHGKVGFARVLPVSSVHQIITDSDMKPEVIRALQEAGPRIVAV
jgi:DeoR family galactitol utilization operon repressor